MRQNKVIKEEYCSTRKELSKKYFGGFSGYEVGNMGIISLLSDVQHIMSSWVLPLESAEHYRQVLNDIKSILIEDEPKPPEDPIEEERKLRKKLGLKEDDNG